MVKISRRSSEVGYTLLGLFMAYSELGPKKFGPVNLALLGELGPVEKKLVFIIVYRSPSSDDVLFRDEFRIYLESFIGGVCVWGFQFLGRLKMKVQNI